MNLNELLFKVEQRLKPKYGWDLTDIRFFYDYEPFEFGYRVKVFFRYKERAYGVSHIFTTKEISQNLTPFNNNYVSSVISDLIENHINNIEQNDHLLEEVKCIDEKSSFDRLMKEIHMSHQVTIAKAGVVNRNKSFISDCSSIRMPWSMHDDFLLNNINPMADYFCNFHTNIIQKEAEERAMRRLMLGNNKNYRGNKPGALCDYRIHDFIVQDKKAVIMEMEYGVRIIAKCNNDEFDEELGKYICVLKAASANNTEYNNMLALATGNDDKLDLATFKKNIMNIVYFKLPNERRADFKDYINHIPVYYKTKKKKEKKNNG